MDKKSLTERDICTKLIKPAIQQVGWDIHKQVREEVSFTKGRIIFLKQVRVAENRIKMPKLNQESLTSFVLPIPPLAEQYPIVAKLDQLMTLGDQLKARLTQARQLNEQLASTLVKQAVA